MFPSVREAALAYGVSPRTMERALKAGRGEIPAYQVIPTERSLRNWEQRFREVSEGLRIAGLAQMRLSEMEVARRLGIEPRPIGREARTPEEAARQAEEMAVATLMLPEGPLVVTDARVPVGFDLYRQVAFPDIGQAVEHARDLMRHGVPSSYLRVVYDHGRVYLFIRESAKTRRSRKRARGGHRR